MKILAGNWKMHKTRAEAQAFFKELNQQLPAGARHIVAASPTLLQACVEWAWDYNIEIFAQNCAWEDQGAFTGETSPLQLKDVGVKGTLVGHSERRTLFGDTDETCGKRAARALSHGLDVIYCIGETLEERETHRTQEVLERQTRAFVAACSKYPNQDKVSARLMLAYEPVWAIGTGKVASLEQVQEAHGLLEKLLTEASLPCPILYGGSVKPSNFKDLVSLPAVSGGLVGGASLTPGDYLALSRSLA